MDLIEQLRGAGKGTEEWRVADPADGSYCIAFSRADCINPERQAREWLEDHRKRFPNSQHANYEVRRVMAQNNADLAMLQAADELERLRRSAIRYQLLRDYRPGLLLDMLTDSPNHNEGYALQLDAVLDAMLPPNAGVKPRPAGC